MDAGEYEGERLMNQSWERPMTRERTFYEPKLAQEQFIVPLLKREIEGRLSKCLLEIPLDGRVLDIGCGGQPFRERVEQNGVLYHGLDANPFDPKTVEYICAIDRELPPELCHAEPYHLILCTEVMEHVAEWDKAFKNLNRLLVPGGKLLMTCPFVYQIHEAPYDFWRPTLYAIKHFAQKYGFEPVDEIKAGTMWDVIGTVMGMGQPQAAAPNFVNRIFAKAIRVIYRMIFNLLVTGKIQNFFKLDGPIYLSNITVLKKKV
ncbi:MAG: class I SAM-dependent methyltransferase [Candidatus Omnitrophica bacterium]|nr:class I SAM-dependent methyltransferase [Candidatus Omnitrophota bacterium]